MAYFFLIVALEHLLQSDDTHRNRAAPLISAIAAKIVQMITVPMASPPASDPSQLCIMGIRSSATPDLSRSMAIKTINRGIVDRLRVNLPMAA